MFIPGFYFKFEKMQAFQTRLCFCFFSSQNFASQKLANNGYYLNVKDTREESGKVRKPDCSGFAHNKPTPEQSVVCVFLFFLQI